jgi:hypothetical protein
LPVPVGIFLKCDMVLPVNLSIQKRTDLLELLQLVIGVFFRIDIDRDTALLAYVATAGTLLATSLQKQNGRPELAIAIPFITFIVGCIIAHHDFMIGRLNRYLQDFRPFRFFTRADHKSKHNSPNDNWNHPQNSLAKAHFGIRCFQHPLRANYRICEQTKPQDKQPPND